VKQEHQLKTQPTLPAPHPKPPCPATTHCLGTTPFGIPGELPKVLGGLPPPHPACTSYLYHLCHSLQDFRIAFKVLGVLRNVLEC